MALPQALAQTTTQTVANNSESTVNAAVPALRTVTYIIRTDATNVNLPYAVEVAGVIGTGFAQKPKSVHCAGIAGGGGNGKISVERVPPGSCVRLYLNSDAHPDYRNNPVYEVTPTTRNVQVQITEKAGHAPETDVLVPKPAQSTALLERYDAKLTGITWMKVTHRYELAEVDALMPAGTAQHVIEAVRTIYAGLTAMEVIIRIPGPPPSEAKVKLIDSDNAAANIATGYDFLREGAKRVHPAAYALFFQAALDVGAQRLTINSGWRPMLGSIAHRAGLGVDVSHLGSLSVDRRGLSGGVGATTNVTAAERQLYNAYMSDRSNAAKEQAWHTRRNADEPDLVKRFREALDRSTHVEQLMDPWLMDTNALDATAATANKHLPGNEFTHRHHLHVTVHEPKIR